MHENAAYVVPRTARAGLYFRLLLSTVRAAHTVKMRVKCSLQLFALRRAASAGFDISGQVLAVLHRFPLVSATRRTPAAALELPLRRPSVPWR